jgi:hypothetical protein
MATASRTAAAASALSQFSMRQIFIAVAVCAVAFSIWRLPHGDWIDIPCTILGFFFALSVARRAVAVRKMLRSDIEVTESQREGGRIYVVGLVALSAALLFAIVLRGLAAAGLIFVVTDHWPAVFYVDFNKLPRNLIVLSLLIALGLRPNRLLQSHQLPARQKMYIATAVACVLLVSVYVGTERMFVPYLVYLAVSGVEMYQSPRLLLPVQNVSTVKRMDSFLIGSGAAFIFMAINLLLIAALANFWSRRRWRTALLAWLAIGFAAQCYAVWWLRYPGLWQLSPPMVEAYNISSPGLVTLVAGTMFLIIVIGAAALVWRSLVCWQPVTTDGEPGQNVACFFESRLAALLVAATSIFGAVGEGIARITSSRQFAATVINLRTLYDLFVDWPMNFLWLAAAVGGLIAYYFRRTKMPENVLPEIDRRQFTVVWLALALFVVISVPVLVATCFSGLEWSFRLQSR